MYKATQKITYYDLDLTGRVKLSALLKMVHVAADVNATQLGIGFAEMSRRNISFILQRFALGVAREPQYGENVTIRTWPDGVARGTFTRKGDMYGENGEKIMEWASLWILFDIAGRKILKPSALPVELPEFKDHGVEITPKKIALPETLGEQFSAYTHTVRYAEVDTNMHMNNSIYGDLIGNALFPTTEAAKVAPPRREVQINYLAETRLGNEIEVTAHHHEGGLLVTGKTPGKLSFAASVH